MTDQLKPLIDQVLNAVKIQFAAYFVSLKVIGLEIFAQYLIVSFQSKNYAKRMITPIK